MAENRAPFRRRPSIRARRSLAAARAAREEIASMVESLRTSRPPRNPKSISGGVRQLPLGPVHIERDESLEEKLGDLQRANAKLAEATVIFKRQAGKYLVKKRLAEKGRIKAEEKVNFLWDEVKKRGDTFESLVKEFEDLVGTVQETEKDEDLDKRRNVVDALERAVEKAKAKTAEMTEWTNTEEEKVNPKGTVLKSFGTDRERGSVTYARHRRDDVKSMYSTASSAVDDETMTEMVALLEARLSKSHPAVQRAREAVSQPLLDMYKEKDELRKERDSLKEELTRSRLVIGKMMKERDLGLYGVGRKRWSDRKEASGITSRGSEAMRKVAEWRKRIEEQQRDHKSGVPESHRTVDESFGLSPQLIPPDREVQSRDGSVASMPVTGLFKSPSMQSLGSDGLGKLTEIYKVNSSRKLFEQTRQSRGLSGIFDASD